MKYTIKLLFLFLLFPIGIMAETLSWTEPTTRINGDMLNQSEIKGYTLCVSPLAPEADCLFTPLFPAGLTSYPLEEFDLDYGQWYFKLRTEDTEGLVSEWSPSVGLFIAAPPTAPANLQIE